MTAIAQLVAEIGVDTSKLKSGLGSAKDAVGGFASNVAGAAGGILKFGGIAAAVAGAAGLGALIIGLKSCIDQGMSQQQVMAQTEAVLKSTKAASGQTAESIGDYADKMAQLTGVSDDTIQASENVLLTFTDIGGKVFPQAEDAILNVSTAMHEDLQSATVQVGKALNDPVKGMTALSRIGVTFTDQQKKTVEQLVATGQKAKAQAIILGELKREFGGSAEAAGETFGGQLKRLGVVFDQMKERIGLILIPILTQMVEVFNNDVMPVISKVESYLEPLIGIIGVRLSYAIQQAEPFISKMAGALAPLTGIFSNLIQSVASLPLPLDLMGPSSGKAADGAKKLHETVSPLQAILNTLGTVIKTVVIPAAQNISAFIKTVVVPALEQFGGFVLTTVVPALIQFEAFIQKNVVPVLIKFGQYVVTNVLPVLEKLAAWFLTKVLPAVEKLVAWFLTKVLPVLEQVWGIIATKVLPVLQNIVETVMTHLVPALQHLWDKLSPLLIPVLHQIGDVLQNVVGPAINTVIGFISNLIDFVGTIIGKFEDFFNLLGQVKDKIASIPGVGGFLHGIGIPGFADGGTTPGGMVMVGERGRELVDLPTGSRVHDHATTESMLHAAQKGMQAKGNTYHVNVYPAKAQLTEEDLWKELRWQELVHG